MTAYTLWNGAAVSGSAGASAAYTLGTQVGVTFPCTLSAIRWYSPAGATVLPSVCGLYDTATTGLVTQDSSPDWRTLAGAIAAAGNGWVRCDFTAASVTLVTGAAYDVAVFQPSAASWYITQSGYWTSGAGAAGLSSGPLFAPDDAGSVNGQGPYDTSGQWMFPETSPGDGSVFYVDLEVIPVPVAGVPAPLSPSIVNRVVIVPVRIG